MYALFDPPNIMDDAAWEALWAPYDQPTYQAVVDKLAPNDIILEIGAGDLRLSKQMAKLTRTVYAIEIQELPLNQAFNSMYEHLPGNLIVIHGDACSLPFPSGITIGVLLMRHCIHFQLYASKLIKARCQMLITNARWRMGVEAISLQEPRVPFDKVSMGWYACYCGAVGFIPGPVGLLTPDLEAIIHEVVDCPRCQKFGDYTKTVS
jgi:hypothetical protein